MGRPFCGPDQYGSVRDDARFHPFRMCSLMRAIDHGLYLPQLASAIDMGVPLSSIAVLQTEQLFRSQMQEPSQALSNLFDWLELPRTGEMESLGKWHATRRAGPSGGFRPPAGN